MKNRSKLGKGLGKLFEENDFFAGIDEGETAVNIAIEDISANPFQPRKKFDIEQLNELASSIKEHGVISPIIVILEDEKYILIAGERRVRAAKLAGLTEIPAIIRDYNEMQMMEIALLENIQREDLTAIEIASSYKLLINNFKLTQEELAKKVGKSRSQVTNMLGLLKLPKVVREKVGTGDISLGHAKVLSKISDKEKVIYLANEVISKKLTVRDLESLAKLEKRTNQIKSRDVFDYSIYKKQIEKIVKLKVDVREGKVIIKFDNLKELENLIGKIC